MPQKLGVLIVGPGIEKCKKYLFVWSHGMLETPFDPPLVIFLHHNICTMPPILCITLFHSTPFYYLNTGTNPSFNNFDFINQYVPDCRNSWYWMSPRYLSSLLLLKNGTNSCTDSLGDRPQSKHYTKLLWSYIIVAILFSIKKIAGIEVRIDDNIAEF